MTTIEIIVSLFVFVGVFFTLVSALGIIRLADVYTRMHAAGKNSTFGVIALIVAAFLYFIPEGIFNVKLLLAILFVFITAPLSALMINRSAYRLGVPLEKSTVHNDLQKEESELKKEFLEKQKKQIRK